MSGTITGTKLAKDLLSGSINAAALETMLTTNSDDYLGAWRSLAKSGSVSALINNTDAFNAVTGSDTALQYLIQNPAIHDAILASSTGRTNLASTSEALAFILNDSTYRSKFLANSNFKTALESAVNNSTYLYRETVTATGNYTPNAAGIAAMFIVAVGKGGTGGTANNNRGGQGGSGGQMVGKHIPVASIPTTAVSCTIPTSAGSPTTFGALVSATSGTNGSASNSTNSGGGTGSGAAANMTNTNLDTAAWHYNDFTEQGGDGGKGGTDGGTQQGEAGEAGVSGSGGSAGVNSSAAGGAGSGLCSGGGGGYVTNVSSGLRNGTAATDPGCGGGGGNSHDGDASYGSGGAGGPAKIWVYTVRKRAA